MHLPDGHEAITVQIMLTHSERRVKNHQKNFRFLSSCGGYFYPEDPEKRIQSFCKMRCK